MAFDGSAVYAIVRELQEKLTDGRILKIAQTEKDELIITVKKEAVTYRLLICVSPSHPVCYLTDQSKNAPAQAPAFCMLLRKHMINGRIRSVSQPSMERIINIDIEHFDEMGDLRTNTLTVELMGKYSNIILRNDEKIIDSIKHVSALMSSVREVCPGKVYFIPFSCKLDPFKADADGFSELICRDGSLVISKALYINITGFSPVFSEEVLLRAGIDSDRPVSSITVHEKELIFSSFRQVMKELSDSLCPSIIYKNGEPYDFTVLYYTLFDSPEYTVKKYNSISVLLSDFYRERQAVTSVRQKTADLRQIVHTLLNKNYKKYDLQLRQLKETEKKDRYRLYGELLTAYGYEAHTGLNVFETTDFYTGEPVSIPLDSTISAIENGKKYFSKYAKLKRTAKALESIIVKTRAQIDHLESIMLAIDMAKDEADIADLRKELSDSGFIRKPDTSKKGLKKPDAHKSKPLHYISSDGFHIYVGKNNIQNDYITFSLASSDDWWFHAKDRPGSHVIVRSQGRTLPVRTFEEAASLAAHYSKSDGESKAEVQYTLRKNLRKPADSRPGFVIFNSYYSMAAPADIKSIRLLESDV